jgi:predicted DsbA family dithiol-disulfide isomerase
MLKLSKIAADFGLPFLGSDKIYNSRLAQELGLWAESKNKGDEFHTAAFRAYFVAGQNIAKMPVLLEIASSVGLPETEAEEVLNKREFRAAVDADWSLSKEKLITAVPTLLLNQDRLVGAQPYKAMEKLMEKNGVKPVI